MNNICYSSGSLVQIGNAYGIFGSKLRDRFSLCFWEHGIFVYLHFLTLIQNIYLTHIIIPDFIADFLPLFYPNLDSTVPLFQLLFFIHNIQYGEL